MKNNTAVTITALAAAACALFTASSQAQSGILVSDTIATAAEELDSEIKQLRANIQSLSKLVSRNGDAS